MLNSNTLRMIAHSILLNSVRLFEHT